MKQRWNHRPALHLHLLFGNSPLFYLQTTFRSLRKEATCFQTFFLPWEPTAKAEEPRMQTKMARSSSLPFLSPCLFGLREACVSPLWDHRSPRFTATVSLSGEINTGVMDRRVPAEFRSCVSKSFELTL